MEKKTEKNSNILNNFISSRDLHLKTHLNLNRVQQKFVAEKSSTEKQLEKIFPTENYKQEIFDKLNNFGQADNKALKTKIFDTSKEEKSNRTNNNFLPTEKTVKKIVSNHSEIAIQQTLNKRLSTTIQKNNTVTNKNRYTNGKTNKITSTITKTSHTYHEKEFIVSIIENYAREVGLAAFNVKTYEIFITQIIDNEAYINTITLINYWNPIEVVMTSKAENSSLYTLIKKIFNGCYVGLLIRKCFDEDFGKEVYMKSMNKELKLVDVNSKYVCMASLSGLIRYLESNSNIILQHDLLKINYHFLENYLNISFKTTLDLELLLNKKYLKSFGTLFSLFKCQTISGFRLLRSNILQPLTNEKDLGLRYEAVNELRGKIDVQQNLKNILSNFKEFEVAICKFMLKNFENTEMKMKQILFAICTLRVSFQNLPLLCEILANKLTSELFKSFHGTVSDKVFLNILSNIEELVDSIDLNQNNNQKLLKKNDVVVMMVKPSLNNVLDVSRKTYSDTITEIYSIYDRIKAVNNDPHMKLNHSDSLGYYLVISEEYFNEQEYIYMKKVSKKVHCSTSTLISLSERVREIKKDIIDISLNLCSDLIALIQRNLNYLFLLSSVIALIDLLCCLSDYATHGNNLTMPKIVKMNQKNNKTRETLLVLNNSRHPVLERGFVNSYYLVPNDYFLCGQFNILLIRGANASGKTTYMKQLALCVILAQIGSFVPAEYMCFTPRNFLYTKFEHNDNQENDLSSFVREIVDIQAIFSNNSQNALILLDEPFDTTISQDATALSWTILDHFVEKFDNSFILISSHNEIHVLSQYYLRVCSGVMETCLDSKYKIISESEMKFSHKFRYDNYVYGYMNSKLQAEKDEENYGIRLAKLIGLPQEIINNSFQIANDIQNDSIVNYIEISSHFCYLKTFLFEFYKLTYFKYKLDYSNNANMQYHQFSADMRNLMSIFLNLN